MAPYGYLRKSSVRNLETDLGPETQEREIRTLAARHRDDAALVVLADWDVSGRGKFTAKRSGYQQLVSAVESGACTAVYSYSLSRLGRSVAELARLFDLCRDHSVPIRLVADAVDTSNASGLLTANMLSAVAQFEADVASERTKAAHATRRARGDLVGPRCYGEGPGEDLQAVVEAFHEAGSYHGAARLLNERRVPTRHGRRGWWASTVQKMVGRIEAVPHRSGRGAKAAPPFALARLLVCPYCGTRLGGRMNYGVARYECARGPSLPHGRRSVAESAILPVVKTEVARLSTPPLVEMANAANARLADLVARKARVLDMYQSGHIDRPDLDRRMAVISQNMAALERRRVVEAVPTIDWTWTAADLNRVLRVLFDEVHVDPETFVPTSFIWAVPEWRG